MKLLISLLLLLAFRLLPLVSCFPRAYFSPPSLTSITDGKLGAHGRAASLATGVPLATRGRRDMSSRVKDVVLALALCHNVSFPIKSSNRVGN